MKCYDFKSIVSAGKSPLVLHSPRGSFRVADSPERIYIEPTFHKGDFPVEHPSVTLVSAWRNGHIHPHTTLVLVNGVAVLDLGKHQNSAAHSLTGVLTESFTTTDLSQVLIGLSQGTYGIIIVGLAEVRSRVPDESFEAFLNDIANRCKVCGLS